MSVFVDTNVLLFGVQLSYPMNPRAARVIATAIREGETLVVTPQIFAEFWNAATRPTDKNGMGLSHAEAHQEVIKLEGFLSILAESVDVFAQWKRLVVEHSVTGVKAHDARIAAAMLVYGVRRILTFNQADFQRYPGIDAISP